MRVAIVLRLGAEMCQHFQCFCGALVDVRGSHALCANATLVCS
jgi:hypothetical protein